MLGFQEKAGLPHTGIDEEVEHRKAADFLVLLDKELAEHRVVLIRIEFRKIIEGYAGLDVECMRKIVIREIQRVSRHKLRNIENMVVLSRLLVEKRVVERELAIFKLAADFQRQVIDAFV